MNCKSRNRKTRSDEDSGDTARPPTSCSEEEDAALGNRRRRRAATVGPTRNGHRFPNGNSGSSLWTHVAPDERGGGSAIGRARALAELVRSGLSSPVVDGRGYFLFPVATASCCIFCLRQILLCNKERVGDRNVRPILRFTRARRRDERVA